MVIYKLYHTNISQYILNSTLFQCMHNEIGFKENQDSGLYKKKFN